MPDILVQIVFGWPFIIISLLCSATGLILKRPWLLTASAIVMAPFSFYLSGWPTLRGFGLALPLFQLAAAYAVHTHRIWMAGLLITPAFVVSGWLAALVITQ